MGAAGDVGSSGGESVQVVSRRDLIASKRAAARPIDLEDVRRLTLDDSSIGDRPAV